MSLLFGVGFEPDLIGALSVPCSFAPRKRRGKAVASLVRLVSSAHERFFRAADLPCRERSAIGPSRRRAVGGEEKEVRDAFARVADALGLTSGERAALFGARELSDIVLALETLGAALDLFRAPHAVVAWLREESPEEPFNDRSPLRLMADYRRLGVEIVLLHLRARLRVAQADSEAADRFLV